MVAQIYTLAFQGVDVTDVEVQVHVSSGLPAFTIVGLPDKAVGESRERVRAALHSIGLSLPPKRITINLAPADLLKEGSHFDLPIIVGLLVSMEVIPAEDISDYLVMGELSLDGRIMPVNGTLPAAMGAIARNKGIICPEGNGGEAAWAGHISILAPGHLLALINHFKGMQILPAPVQEYANTHYHYPDLKDIKGQESAKRALEIAAAGGHNMLMSGPPGSGKSMLASRLPGLIPELDVEEMLYVNIIASIAGNIADGKLQRMRPFRDPHHSCSMAAMVGGGRIVQPGEITLAHHGVLFLDELPEFSRNVLDALRQPIETGKVTVSRVNSHVTYPARFQLVAAMNPCRCGYLSDAERACNKAPRCGEDYQSRISGPLFDRMDIHIEVPAVNVLELERMTEGESSATVRERTLAARDIQKTRYKGTGIRTNAEADGELLRNTAELELPAKELLHQAAEKMRLSMRGYNRVLRVARTIGDLEEVTILEKRHIAEALTYRQMYRRS